MNLQIRSAHEHTQTQAGEKQNFILEGQDYKVGMKWGGG